MTLLLAPMEGLLDFTLRDILTRVGGIDRCVTEFIRVTGTLLPERALLRVMPELRNGSRTPAGTLVRAQLMGSDAACLAENAARLAEMGSAGVDLNFGCPAKVVNRHGGGAALLVDPPLLNTLMSAVRRAVPAGVPVSAKMRLGFNDDSLALDCARALESGGAEELVVHARTRADGYKPPAYWDRIVAIREALSIPVIANGEIWSADDARRCREVTGCDTLMLGRGMVSNPGLALSIASAGHAVPWKEILPLMQAFWDLVCSRLDARQCGGRLKQWLNYLRRHYPEAQAAYAELRTVNDPREIARWLREQLAASTHREPELAC
jgi:tRNA-dihydrouridine synthase C